VLDSDAQPHTDILIAGDVEVTSDFDDWNSPDDFERDPDEISFDEFERMNDAASSSEPASMEAPGHGTETPRRATEPQKPAPYASLNGKRPSKRACAIAYARQAMRVFPCHEIQPDGCSCGKLACPSAGKHPRIKDWQTLATCDEGEIRKWWQSWPNANIGVACGARSDLTVLDVDGEEGRWTLRELEGEHGELPETPVAITGSGGAHYYFAYEPGLGNAIKFAAGLDVRTEGGLVVGVGSVTKQPYRWEAAFTLGSEGLLPARMPKWLAEKIASAASMPATNGHLVLPETIPAGERNNWLYRLTRGLKARGMSANAILLAVQAENSARCSPPMPDNEIRALVEHATTQPDQRGFQAPELQPQQATAIGKQWGKDEPARTRTASKNANANVHSIIISEETLALEFVQRRADDLRYVAAWGKWLVWDGYKWVLDDTLKVYDFSRKLVRESAAGNPKLLSQIANAHTVAAVEKLARADRRVAATNAQWDSDSWLLNTPGGIVDLRSGELRPASRTAYATKSTAVAPAPTLTCPHWLRFLDRVMSKDEAMIAFLQRTVGYALTGSVREHAVFFNYGHGANGKTTFTNTCTGFLADYATVAAAEIFMVSISDRHPTELAALRGARLVTAAETEEGRLWAEERVKSLSGGDPITARYMRQDFFTFQPQFKLLICGNHRPSLRNVDPAIRRRLYLIPWAVEIPKEEQDIELGEKLRAEWPGILRWALEGCLAWQRDGLNPPAAVIGATSEYFADEDAIGRWVAERCLTGDATFTARTRILFADWESWAKGGGTPVGSEKTFSQRLEAQGYQRGKDAVTRQATFKRIRLRESEL